MSLQPVASGKPEFPEEISGLLLSANCSLTSGEEKVAQIKIYGLETALAKRIEPLSNAIHAAVMDALQYPEEKRFHRFICLERNKFLFPADRSENYTIIEISMFAGRSTEAKKTLIRLLFSNIQSQVGIQPQDVEITIVETPRENWGIRGLPGDELSLGYTVNV